MLKAYSLTPDQVDSLDAEFIDALDADAWATNEHETLKKQRAAVQARMAARRK